MTPQPEYQRVDHQELDRRAQDQRRTDQSETNPRYGVRWFILPLCIALSIAQSILWVMTSNLKDLALAGTLIPVMGYGLLVLMVLVVNPLLKVLHLGRTYRPLGRVEMMTLFAAMLVTSGISTFGMAEQLVPLVAAPYDERWNTAQRGWDTNLLPALNPHLYITDPSIIRDYRTGMGPSPAETASWSEHIIFYASVAWRIPWLAWLAPLGFWMIFVLSVYGLFYSLTFIVLRVWSEYEQLTFPLAKLPEAVLPDADGTRRWVPSIFKSRGFWIGFAFTLAVLLYNGIARAGWLPGLSAIKLGMSSWRLNDMFAASHPHLIGSTAALVIFTVIGLAFLLPLEMSFSVWFYYLVGRATLYMLVVAGYGSTMGDFPSDFMWNANAISAQGGGGLFVFSAVSLAKCLLDWRRLVQGRPLRERISIGFPVVGLAISSLVITLWLEWNGLPFYWGLLFVAFMTLLTLGVMRIVAQSGIYWFQSHTSFFHIWKAFGLGGVMVPSIIMPILPIYSVLFMDIKCFLAPNIMTASKLQSDVGGDRWRYHLTLILSILASVLASLLFVIYLSHVRGANQMHNWFYNICPQMVMETTQTGIETAPRVSTSSSLSFVFGGIWVALSLYLRQTLFWFPHPLGYIMLINPLMDQMWFSFFIAWSARRLLDRYGGKFIFDRTKNIVLGLIYGELMAIMVWTIVLLITSTRVEVSLNRYGD